MCFPYLALPLQNNRSNFLVFSSSWTHIKWMMYSYKIQLLYHTCVTLLWRIASYPVREHSWWQDWKGWSSPHPPPSSPWSRMPCFSCVEMFIAGDFGTCFSCEFLFYCLLISIYYLLIGPIRILHKRPWGSILTILLIWNEEKQQEKFFFPQRLSWVPWLVLKRCQKWARLREIRWCVHQTQTCSLIQVVWSPPSPTGAVQTVVHSMTLPPRRLLKGKTEWCCQKVSYALSVIGADFVRCQLHLQSHKQYT